MATVKVPYDVKEEILMGVRGTSVHKLFGNFSATLGFFGNFRFVEQLSMHWATAKFLPL